MWGAINFVKQLAYFYLREATLVIHLVGGVPGELLDSYCQTSFDLFAQPDNCTASLAENL